MADEPLQIIVQFDTTQPEQALDRLEERARRGVNVSPEGTTRRGGTPAAGPPGSVAAQLQAMGGATQDAGYRTRAARVDRSWDQAAFSQFKDEERAELRMLRARERQAVAAERLAERDERRASRTRMEEQETSLSGMGPNERRTELMRMAEIETDPQRRTQLERRAAGLRTRTGLNTNILGMGNYFNLMFGSWEIAQAYQAQSQAKLQASVAETDIERMSIRARAASEATGIFGSIITSGWNILGRVTGIDSPEKVAETALLETRRRQSQDTVRDSQVRRTVERDLQAVAGESEARIEMEKARIRQEDRHRAANTRFQQIGGQISETKDEGLKTALRAEQQELIEEKKAADTERDSAETQITRVVTRAVRQQNLATNARNDMFIGRTLRGVIGAIDAKFDPIIEDGVVTGFEGKKFRGSKGTRYQDIADIDYAAFESKLHDYLSQINAAKVVDEQRRMLLRSSARASQLRLGRDHTAAQLVEVLGERDALLKQTDDPERAREIREAYAGRAAEIIQARADQIQNININQGGRAAQIAALLRRDPIGANVAGIVSGARAEEAQLRQAGLNAQADRARQLGIEQLKLEKQNYLDSFQGVQVSKDFAAAAILGLIKNKGEDPAAILKNIEDAKKGLGVPGAVNGDVPGLLQKLIETVKELGAFITN